MGMGVSESGRGRGRERERERERGSESESGGWFEYPIIVQYHQNDKSFLKPTKEAIRNLLSQFPFIHPKRIVIPLPAGRQGLLTEE